jgi:predicted lysophospholipase L1 biosynthesis ABC-type transport system permease subunit
MTLREDYDIPERTSLGTRMWVVMGVLPLAALLLWLVAPSSPVAIAVLAIALLALVFGGVAWALSSRDLRRAPGRNPETPPSAR